MARGMAPADRFWSKVDRSADCWEWMEAKDKGGYGVFWLHGRSIRAPRAAWQFANGEPIPAGMVVRHRCDNPPCVRPDHLELGTPRDNDMDRVARGRSAFGDRNGSRLYPERLRRGVDHPHYRPGGCRNGHPAERRYVRPSTGERVCRDCVKEAMRRVRAKARCTP